MTAKPTCARRLADRAIIGVFLSMIGLPFAGAFLRPDLMARAPGRRPVAAHPAQGPSKVATFPQQFESWFNDHFGFRKRQIQGLSHIEVRALGVSVSSNVVLGRDGWLYYSESRVGTDFNAIRPFTVAELDRWRRVLEGRQQWLRRHGCEYLLFLPPDKQTIYREHLPPQSRPRHASVRLAQLIAHLQKNSTVPVIDVRQQLLAAKLHERVYHATDSHWNARGAFIGYHAVASELARRFPPINPIERSQCDDIETDRRGGDLAGLINLRDLYHERRLDLSPRYAVRAHKSSVPVVGDPANLGDLLAAPYALETGDTALPRGVLFHDSFAQPLIPMLAEHFQRLATIWDDEFHPDIVLREHPDIVIQQLVERKLGFVKPTEIGE
jgi:hypothetical protein